MKQAVVPAIVTVGKNVGDVVVVLAAAAAVVVGEAESAVDLVAVGLVANDVVEAVEAAVVGELEVAAAPASAAPVDAVLVLVA